MISSLLLAAALIGGPTSPPPVAAVHDAAPWQSIPGPVTLAPKCTGCALEMVVSGIGMENSTGPINMQQNSPPVRANWTWTSDNGMVVFGAVYSPDDRDGECHVVGDVCEEDYYCVTRMELIIYNVGLMRVVGDKAYWGGCDGGEGSKDISDQEVPINGSGSLFPSYTGFGGMPDPCCGGWIKHVYKVQMLDVGSQKWLDVGQIRTHISCGICYWKTVTP